LAKFALGAERLLGGNHDKIVLTYINWVELLSLGECHDLSGHPLPLSKIKRKNKKNFTNI